MIFGWLAGPLLASSALLPCKGPAQTMLQPVYCILLYAQSMICTTAESTHSMSPSTDLGSRTAQGHKSGACSDANAIAKGGAWQIRSHALSLIHC